MGKADVDKEYFRGVRWPVDVEYRRGPFESRLGKSWIGGYRRMEISMREARFWFKLPVSGRYRLFWVRFR